MACNICNHQSITEISGFSNLKRVTSDCKPFKEGGNLVVCSNCSTVQKPISSKLLTEINGIYDNYAVYHQSEGKEQAVFHPQTGQPIQRSHKLIEFLNAGLTLNKTGQILDFGCANGSFLSAFSNQYSGWNLYGFDLSKKYQQHLQQISNFQTLFNDIEKLSELKFDLITSIHTVEHLIQPADLLRKLSKSLQESASLLIQVPNASLTPFDLLVADHISHFSIETLNNLFQVADLIPTGSNSSQWISKEISVLTAPYNGTKRPLSLSTNSLYPKSLTETQQAVRWLNEILNNVESLTAKSKIGVLGTAIPATWLLNYFEKIEFFVDEDPNRQGKEHFGRMVYAPQDAPKDLPVFVPLSPIIIDNVCKRLAKLGIKYVKPTDFYSMNSRQELAKEL